MAINYNEEEFGLQLPNNNQGIMEVAKLYNTPDGALPYWGPGQYNYNEGMLNTPDNPETLNFTKAVNEYGYPLMASLSGNIPNKVSAIDQLANYDWSGFDDNIAKNMMLAKQMNATLDNTLGEESVNPWTSFYGNPELYQGFVERGEPLAVSSTPSKWEQITGRVGDVWQGAKDQLGSGWETLKTKAQIPLGIMGAVANRYNALNPNAVNYNPALAGQIDFMKEQGAYGSDWDQSGLNKITAGRLAGKNLQSLFGSNDLMEMYEKDLARLEKTLANLPKKWSKLMKDNPTAYNNKVKAFQDKIAQNKWEQEQARKDLEQRNRIRLGSHLVQDRNYRSDPELSRIGREKYTGQGQAFQQRKGTTTKKGGQTFHYGGRKDGGRIGYANGGLASLFTRRG